MLAAAISEKEGKKLEGKSLTLLICFQPNAVFR